MRSSKDILALLVVFLIIAIIRILGPTDIYQGDQPKQADYVMDIVVNHNFWLQHHEAHIVASKPPLYNWLAAPLLTLYPHPIDFLLKLPSLFAGFFALLFLYKSVKLLSDETTAFWATIFLLTTGIFAKQMYFARTDMLLMLWIIGQVYCMLLIAEKKSNQYTLFSLWLMGGLGIITKGPIAVLFPHFIVSSWALCECNWKNLYRQLGFRWGWILLLAPTIIWLTGVYWTEGFTGLEQIYRRMIITETLNRLNPSSEPAETRHFLYYTWHYLARTLPWSIPGIIALIFIPWRSIRAPHKNKSFIALALGKATPSSSPPKTNLSIQSKDRLGILGLCWVISILLFLSVFPSKRIVRIFPAVPGICILAAYMLRLNWNRLKNWYIEKILWLTVAIIVVAIFLDKFYFGSPARSDAELTKELVLAAKNATKESGASLLALKGSPYPLGYFLFDPYSEYSAQTIKAMLGHTQKPLWIVGTLKDLKELEEILHPFSYTTIPFELKKNEWKKEPYGVIKINLESL